MHSPELAVLTARSCWLRSARFRCRSGRNMRPQPRQPAGLVTRDAGAVAEFLISATGGISRKTLRYMRSTGDRLALACIEELAARSACVDRGGGDMKLIDRRGVGGVVGGIFLIVGGGAPLGAALPPPPRGDTACDRSLADDAGGAT